MVTITSKISPCLWFDSEAEQAARHYIAIFEDSGIDAIAYYGKEGFEQHGRPEGSVMTVAFHLAQHSFVALNGGPLFKFSEAVSFQVYCDDQDEIDRKWAHLTEGGKPGMCGWLTDKFGLAWQIVPRNLPGMMLQSDGAAVARVTRAFMGMTKLDKAEIERAFRGER